MQTRKGFIEIFTFQKQRTLSLLDCGHRDTQTPNLFSLKLNKDLFGAESNSAEHFCSWFDQITQTSPITSHAEAFPGWMGEHQYMEEVIDNSLEIKIQGIGFSTWIIYRNTWKEKIKESTITLSKYFQWRHNHVLQILNNIDNWFQHLLHVQLCIAAFHTVTMLVTWLVTMLVTWLNTG